MNEIVLTYLQLPITVNGLVVPTPDGDYQVVLNSRLSLEAQRKAYCHELRHILLNHFSADMQRLESLEDAANLDFFLQSQIEQAEEQGIPLSKIQNYNSQKLQNQHINANSNIKTISQKTVEIPKKSYTKSPALLRAVRAQHTGLRY